MVDTTAQLIRDQLGKGEYVLAADLGATAIDDGPADADVELVWLTALALARCGATDRAETLVDNANLLQRSESADARLHEDVGALHARLSKDRALNATGSRRAEFALDAAKRYQQLAGRFDSHYSTVNSATMFLLAGEPNEARDMARQTLALLENSAGSAEDAYWRLASQAEALLILGESADAKNVLARAAETQPDWAMRSTTLKQARLVCDLVGSDYEVLSELGLPSVAHFTGHMFRSGPEDSLKAQIVEVLTSRNVGAVYGSLVCGSDVVVAEAALDAGIEVHIYLPCPVAQFLERSVTPGGPGWAERWDQVRDRATSFDFEPTQALQDAAMFGHCDQLAMGNALIRARQLGSDVFQLALWDGSPGDEIAGTAAAVNRWKDIGGITSVIQLDRDGIEPVTPAPTAPEPTDSRNRGVKAMLFADVKGFSKLTEAQLPEFYEQIMGSLAVVLGDYGDSVLYRNTWGDAIYAVFDEASTAARCALQLQERLAELAVELGRKELSARIGGHAGPIFDGYDHVCDESTFYGTHVTRAARIEPRTPPGEVYVTSDFAALTALASQDSLRMEYVGHVPTAKDYGSFPMYVLRR